MSAVAVGVAGASLVGGMMQADAAKTAAEKAAQAQLNAGKLGADAAAFNPFGTSTRFGSSEFGYNQQGRLNQAGYTLSPELQAQQDYMMQMANQGLDQYGMGRQYAQPMLQGSQDMMGLGQQYLSSSPQEQAQKYMANQQALLNPSRMQQLSGVRQDLFNTGRTGLATGGEGGTMAANPEMAAYYNSIAQQDAQLAAQAEQQGMQYAQFGAGMMGSGGDMLSGYYGAQGQAMQPYQQAMSQAQMLEAMGQGSMDIGTSLGAKQSTAGATQGQMIANTGMMAAQSRQAADSYSPWGSMLSGASKGMQGYRSPQTQGGDPYAERNYGSSGVSTEDWFRGGY